MGESEELPAADSVDRGRGGQMTGEMAQPVLRKVARSGHVSFQGQLYFVSKLLAGQQVQLVRRGERLIVDATIPLHKEFALDMVTLRRDGRRTRR